VHLVNLEVVALEDCLRLEGASHECDLARGYVLRIQTLLLHFFSQALIAHLYKFNGRP
jgi:hypothetical protein